MRERISSSLSAVLRFLRLFESPIFARGPEVMKS